LTVTLGKFLLAITAYWNKTSLFIGLLIISFSLSAQKELEGERLRLFNEQFFAAQNAKNRGDAEEALVIFESLYKKDPKNAAISYELAQLYAAEEAPEKSIFHAERAYSLDPDNSWYLKLKLAVYRQFDKQEALQKALLQTIERSDEKSVWRFQLAEAYYQDEEPQKALEQLELVEQEIGLSEQISNQKKSIYLELGDLEAAANELKKLIAAFPRKLDYRGALGQLYQANGENEKAMEMYQSMLALDSTDPRPHLDLANYYRIEGEYCQSIYHLKKAMVSRELDMERKIAVLLSLFEASQNDSLLRIEAFQILDEIIALEPEDPRIYAMYGDYLSRDGKDREAVAYYKKALKYGEQFAVWEQILLIEMQNRMFDALREDAPEASLSFPNQPLPYLLGGIAFNEGEEYQKALEMLESGVNYVFDNPQLQFEFYVQLAAAYHQLESHRESDSYFEKALAISPNNAVALNNYAYYLSLRRENLRKALAMSTKANEISPQNPVYLDTKAWILFEMKRLEEAREVMEQALSLMSNKEAEVLEHYGDILAALGENEAAAKAYQEALSLEPNAQVEAKISKLNQ